MAARATAVAVGVWVALLVFAIPAHASYTIGAPDINASPAGVPGSGATLFQESDAGATLTATGPGVIVAFRARFAADGAPHPINFRVMRPELGNRFTMISSTASTVPAGAGFVAVEQPARVPIGAGQLIGVDASSGVSLIFTGAPLGTTMSQITPIVGDGAMSTPATLTPVNPGRMLLNATVEPDADGDGFGDESQDRCPGTAGPADGCVVVGPRPSNEFTLGKVKRKKRRGTATVVVEVVDGPGSLELSKSRKVKADQEKILGDGAGKSKLEVVPRGPAARKLDASGSAKLAVAVTYTPDGGDPKTQTERLKLIRK